MIFARIVLVSSALAFLCIGLPGLIFPQRLAGLTGIELVGPLADNDFRAIFGGLQCGCGLALLTLATSAERLRTGLVLQAFLFAGLFVGRLASLATEGSPGPFGLALQGAEFLGLLCGLVALGRLRETR